MIYMDNYTQGVYCRDTIHPGHGNYSGSNTLTFFNNSNKQTTV